MNVINQLDKLYTKSGFANQYGGSIVVATLISIVFFGLTSYFYIKGHLSEIRANWVEKRCHPQYIPFAGMIHPEKGKSTFDTTSENFNYCMNGILGEISEYETEPLHYATAAIHSLLRSISGAVQVFRMFAKEIRDAIVRVFDEIYAKIEAVLVPIHLIFLKNKDIIHRTQGIMITVVYGVFAAYESLRSFLGAFIEVVIIALIILAAAIAALFASFFGIPAAIAFLAIFVTVVGLITPVIVWSEELLDVTSNKKVPSKPSCFSGDTQYSVYSKSWLSRKKKECKKKMKNIQPGDEIVRNKYSSIPQIVTATMEMSGYLSNVVMIDGVRVSSNHPIEWTEELREKAREQREHKYLDTIEISRVNLLRKLQIGQIYPAKIISRALHGANGCMKRLSRLYCLGTTSKVIRLGNINATDWDELEHSDIEVLREFLGKALDNRNKKSFQRLTDESYSRLSRTTLSWIHRYLDYGLHGDTRICINQNGSTQKLSNLKVGSKIVIPMVQSLQSDDEFKIKNIYIQDVVLGIVKIETNLLNCYEYEWYDVWDTDKVKRHSWVGSANCMRYVRSNEVFTSQRLPAFYSKYDTTLNWTDSFTPVNKPPKYLYNIVTGTGLLMANGVIMYDYNGGIDNILGETKINVPRNC